jgi:hypothetical protein
VTASGSRLPEPAASIVEEMIDRRVAATPGLTREQALQSMLFDREAQHELGVRVVEAHLAETGEEAQGE